MSTRTRTAIKLTIDGVTCSAREGETVLEVAGREGIDIPALCHVPGTPAWGACRLCLVEVEGLDKLQAACTTWVAEDMVVKTDTPRVRARRTSYLKMYLSDHNAYCEAPCTHACPTHVDIPGYLAALAAGDTAGAAAILSEELPFPGILGRVCPRYCEPVCRRGDLDEPVAICALHRAVADHAGTRLSGAQASGKRVAIIGSGPAGLAAAWFLARQGHQSTLYDAEAKPGGSLRYAIPEFRLPDKVLDDELKPLWDANVHFVGQSRLGNEDGVDELLKAGFDAVIVSSGGTAQPDRLLPGRDSALRGLEFLRRTREDRAPRLTGKVAVVGDGTMALDVARTSLRLGATEVVVVAKHQADEMPAGDHHVASALEEGVKFETGTEVAAVQTKDGKAHGLDCARGGTRFDVAADIVILAESAAEPQTELTAEPHRAGPKGKKPASEGTALKAHPLTGRTSRAGVFGAGDVVGGPCSVIHAVASGKRAALAIDAWFGGKDLAKLEQQLASYSKLSYLDQLKADSDVDQLVRRLADRDPVWLKMGASAQPAARTRMPTVRKAKRLSGVDIEVEKGYTLASAQAEAERCLQCVCPSLGSCELQKLGVEYGIAANELAMKGSRVRVLEPQLEHPFIRRDMERCIACGRCVRVCRDVAGPACYDFTGRGFGINVNTPYGEALQLADCISCGRCVTTCPTGALTFNERQLSSFQVDENRCIMCRECIDVCPVDALSETNHFEEARQRWLELVDQGSLLAGGHRMCAGCGAPIVVRQVLMGADGPVVASAATGCLEVSTSIYPYTSWKGGFIHTAFENSAATMSGVETAYRALKKKGLAAENMKFIAFGGDGGTYDIGLQSLSGAMERGHKMLYVCYDNGAYMNTGFQRSGATPVAAWTTTSPVGEESAGKLQHRKNLTEVMVAHGIEYVAQASPHDPRDLVRKAARALAVDGPTFLNVLAPCPRGWRSDGAESIDMAREAVNTCYWPLFEVEKGEYRLTYRPHHKLPLVPWLKRQGRFAHLFKPGFEWALENLEAWVDEEWEKLLRKCHEPSEAEWQAHLQANGCLLR